jgi:hypothetical protein
MYGEIKEGGRNRTRRRRREKSKQDCPKEENKN